MSFLNNFNKNRLKKNNFFHNFWKIKKLKIGWKKNAGRNNQGKITVRSRGGGLKKKYTIIDLQRNFLFFWNIPAMVLSIEYDYCRSNFISLILYSNGFLSYILHIHNLKIGQIIFNNYFNKGLASRYPLYNGLINQKYCQISYYSRAAGTFVKYLGLDVNMKSILLLPSGKKVIINSHELATFGENSNKFHYLNFYFKAGQVRNLNKRPKVRGVAMNPIDHPHGGGQGKTSGGRISVTPWGIYTKGYKTVR